MKLDFRNADFSALARCWNRFYPEKFAVDADLIRFNTVESPVFDWGASAIETDDSGDIRGFVLVKKSAAGLYRGPDPDTAHLSAISFCDPNVGVDLFSGVRSVLRHRGIARIVYGMDSRHFFPGCPSDMPGLLNYLMIEGFTSGGESVDLERNLSDYANPFPVPDRFEFRMARESDWTTVQEFFAREFPGRWRYDVSKKIDVEGIENCVYGLFEDGRCEGFALLQSARQKTAIAGGVWREDLGENWGSLGPIGISKSVRGLGAGNALLGKALEHQRDTGVHRCIIDWTTLVGFYGGHGFEVSRTYRSMTLSLDS